MRCAAILGLGTSRRLLEQFRAAPEADWIEGVPASSAEADAVVIFGGDGTIHRHLGLLVPLALPVLVVPAGSGNDFARALGIRSDVDALQIWRDFTAGKQQPKAIDLGVIHPLGGEGKPTYFCCVAGCGLDSPAARRANQMPRWLRSHGGYVLALLPTVAEFRAVRMRLTTRNGDQQETRESPTVLAAIANGPYYGHGMKIAPRADMGDGKLDICRVGQINRLKLGLMFPSVYIGRHLAMKEVEYSQAERVRIETDPPIEVYADGEYVCATPAEITVAQAALRVIARTRI
jgi:diacylglycerol kinase (ATP)